MLSNLDQVLRCPRKEYEHSFRRTNEHRKGKKIKMFRFRQKKKQMAIGVGKFASGGRGELSVQNSSGFYKSLENVKNLQIHNSFSLHLVAIFFNLHHRMR